MEIESLRILGLLVADPNLSHAAERLHVTQSALSKRVAAMEAEIGTKLFERRGPKGLRPLPQALEIARLADRMLSAWDSGVKRIQRSAEEPEHFVLVGPPLFLREIVLPWWNQTSSKFPHLQLEVHVSSLERVSLETIQSSADAGILEHKEELADYVCKPIYTERWGVVRNPKITHKSLGQYTWGTYSTRSNPVDIWLVQRQKISPPTYKFYWQDLTALALWIAETPGAASVLPWHVVASLSRQERVLFEPLGPDATTRLYLAYPKDSPYPQLIKAISQITSESMS